MITDKFLDTQLTAFQGFDYEVDTWQVDYENDIVTVYLIADDKISYGILEIDIYDRIPVINQKWIDSEVEKNKKDIVWDDVQLYKN